MPRRELKLTTGVPPVMPGIAHEPITGVPPVVLGRWRDEETFGRLE
jgi:hypothetical protein